MLIFGALAALILTALLQSAFEFTLFTSFLIASVPTLVPTAFCAFYQKNGLPFWKIAEIIFRQKVRYKPIRLYKTKNFYYELTNSNRSKSDNKREKANSKDTTNNQYGKIFNFLHNLFGDKNAPQTAQDTIPYREMRKDGIAVLNDGRYSKTIEFYDINYHLAKPDEQIRIFEAYSDILNYFDDTMDVQFSFINSFGNIEEIEKDMTIFTNRRKSKLHREFADMVKNQLEKGNNGLTKRKFLTFTISAKDIKQAKTRLERIEIDVISNFKLLGVNKVYSLSGVERLSVLYKQLNPESKHSLLFNYKDIAKTGLTTKDFIAPTSFDFRNLNSFKIGDTYGAAYFMEVQANQLADTILKEITEINASLGVNIHLKAINQEDAIKQIKTKLTDIQRMKISEQKKAMAFGYDMDILPPDLVTYEKEAQKLLKDLTSHDERMFMATIIITATAHTKKKLDEIIISLKGISQRRSCPLRPLDYMQEQGFLSSLPLGLNEIQIQRALTTSPVAGFIPFTTQELMHKGQSLYYGINPLSSNILMADRSELSNPNGLVFGTPGSGKSFWAKREMVNVFLTTNDTILVLDPEGEYSPLVENLKGQIIRLSPASSFHINPMEINDNYAGSERGKKTDPIPFKADFLMSMVEVMMGVRTGLTAGERTIIDRCVNKVYSKWKINPIPENIPILEDLWNAVKEVNDPEAENIAKAMELYVKGSMNIFNHKTNVDINNRFICYDVKELVSNVKQLGMLIVQDFVWNKVTVNRSQSKKTYYYMDEFHLLLRDPETAKYTVEVYKRFRKWGGIPTAMTQNIKVRPDRVLCKTA